MTRFIPNFSTDQLLPPWISLGARNWVFALEVPRACLQNFLDNHFNCPAPDYAPYYYEALEAPYGILRVTTHDNFSSAHFGTGGYQTLSKIDVNWSYPVHRWQVSEGNIRFDEQLVWVEPMAFDNNSYTMFSSREIWGTEVDMARIEVREDHHPDRMHIDVAMQGLPEFTPKSISHLIGVLHVGMNPEVETDPISVIDKHPRLADFVGTVFSAIGLQGSYDHDHNCEVNTLKQFRDVFNMRVAVYRAIIASRTDNYDVCDLKWYDGDNVSLDFMWSQSMDEALREYFGIDYNDSSDIPLGHPDGSHMIDGHDVDWVLPRINKNVVLAASYQSHIRYEVLKTLHTYGN